jgi:mxaJ protein
MTAMRAFPLQARHWQTLLMIAAASASISGGVARSRGVHAAPAPVLRVCADPNNLPFSNQAEQGFENDLARLLARDLGAKLEYTWWAQRRGFFRRTLKAGLCDVVMGAPVGIEIAATTSPYYRSGYVFVARAERNLGITSFDDPRLRSLKIGVQVIGDDYANTPPVDALSRRNIASNVTGYSVYGDYALENPPAAVMTAVENGDVDVAVVWGPLAGFFAKRAKRALALTPIAREEDGSGVPLVFDIAMAVRPNDTAGRARLESFIERRRREIDAILIRYGVPRR